MFASYTGKLGSRSLSTTDVCRLGDDDKDEQQRDAPRRSFSTTMRAQRVRRPTTRPPPVPVRTPSGSGSEEDWPTAAAMRVRSYLSDDIRQQFESTASERVNSPSSSNFVKKLVASLERRHKQDSGQPYRRHASFSELRDRSIVRRLNSASVPPRSASRGLARLEGLREAANEDEEDDGGGGGDDYDDDESDCSDDYFAGDARPALIRQSPAEGEGSDKPKGSAGRRSLLKSVFSSLVNWRIGGSKASQLPKGSRQYYATRESLGEEMRAFRRDTMPRLLEHAALGAHIDADSNDRPRRDTRDFARLIPRPAHQQQPHSPRSIATIRPIYNSCNKTKLLATAAHTQSRPTTTTRTTTATVGARSPDAQAHLLRPSRLRDLQKRLSLEIDSLAAGAQLGSNGLVQLYDVPRSNRPVIVQHYDPQYQNIEPAISQDKRLSCSLFTTF